VITSMSVAASANEVIGAAGGLPWHLPEDLRRFRTLTAGHAVVLGRLTHESIVARLGRPLPGRTSVVVSSRPPGADPAVIWVTSVARAMAAAQAAEAGGPHGGSGTAEVFVAGGVSVYAQALPLVGRVYLTRLHREVAGDTRMPDGWLDGFALVSREDRAGDGPGGGYSFLVYERPAG
jgi:dihydrofolate reductase